MIAQYWLVDLYTLQSRSRWTKVQALRNPSRESGSYSQPFDSGAAEMDSKVKDMM